MALGDILNHYPNSNNFPLPRFKTMEFRDRNGNGIEDRDEEEEARKQPSVIYLPYPMPQPGMENQTEGFNIGRFAGAVAPIIAGLFGGGSGAPDFTTPYDDLLNPNRQHTFADFDGNYGLTNPPDPDFNKDLNERYPLQYPYETLTG